MKIAFSFLLLICTAYSSVAQDIELMPLGGYTFADQVSISGGEARLKGSFIYGGMLSVGLNEFYSIEFLYSRQPTSVRASSVLLDRDYDGEAAVSYYMLGGRRLLPTGNPTVNMYTGLKLGAVSLDARNRAYELVTRFAVNVELGVKFDLTEQLGFRMGSSLSFPIVNTGASLWWGTSGANVGVSSWSPITQFNLLGGIYLRFPRSGASNQ